MNLEKLRKLLKEHKYVLIDYSEKFRMDIDHEKMKIDKRYEHMMKIKAINTYMEMDNRLKQDKYSKLVFMLDISKVAKYNSIIFHILVQGGEIPLDSDILYLKNSDNFIWFKSGENIKDNIIINFINQKNKQYECNVCFEEYGIWTGDSVTSGSYCGVCDFRTCYKCCIKATANNLNARCFGCRTAKTNSYTMMK